MKKIVLIIFILIQFGFVYSQSVQQVVKVAISEYWPIMYVNGEGVAQGFYPEVLNAIAEEEGWIIQYVEGSWAEGLDQLQNGDVDLVMSVTMIDERREFMDFTDEYMLIVWGRVFTGMNSNIEDISDLAGKSVGIVKDTAEGQYFIDLLEEWNIEANISEIDKTKDIYEGIHNGRFDAGVTESIFGYLNVDDYNVMATSIMFEPSKLGFAVKKNENSYLIEAINQRLLEMKSDIDSVYYSAMRYWLEIKPIREEVVPLWMINVLVILALIVVIFAIWVVKSRFNALNEKNRMEKRLFQSQKMESIGNLAGGIAHDFNNLLTVIRGYADMMSLDQSLSDYSRNAVKEIIDASENAAFLTNQLLTFSRRQISQPAMVNLNEIIRNYYRMLNRLIGEDIELVIDLNPLISSVYADKGHIHQILMNIIINSRDAIGGQGLIEIKTRNIKIDRLYTDQHPDAKPGDYVLLQITDNGAGIDKKIRDRIFDPFFTTKEMGKGTGLGLSVVYGIIKDMNGWITVYSEPGEGACFNIYLPAYDEKEEITDRNEKDYNLLYGKGELLLVIEDEDKVRSYTERILRKFNYNVQTVSRLKSAEQFLKANLNQVRLIVCDVVLPDGNGVDFIEKTVGIEHAVKVLFFSGYTDVKSRKDIIEKKGYAFLKKPFSYEDLLSAVKSLLT